MRFCNSFRPWMSLPAVALLACSGEAPAAKSPVPIPGSGQERGKLVISGSSTMAPLLKDIGDHFFALHPGVRVEVNAGGSAKGLSLLAVQTKIEDLSKAAYGAMLEARRNEKDFLLGCRTFGFKETRSRYTSLLRMHTDEVQQAMQEIRSLTKDQLIREQTQAIDQAIGEYETGFMKPVELTRKQTPPETGLESRFLKKIGAVEAILERKQDHRLLSRLLALRRAEKNYLLRGLEEYVRQLKEGLERFEEELVLSELPLPLQFELLASLHEYRDLFLEYVDIENDRDVVKESYLTAVHRTEPALEKLLTWAERESFLIQNEVEEAATANVWTVSFIAAGAAIFGLLVAIGISRRIATGVRECITLAQRIAQGDLEGKMPAGLHGEFGVLAAALDTMASSLRDSRQVRERQASDLGEANQALQHEIIERKQVGEELQQAKEAAEAANTAKTAFLANTSHEIRTPMTAILGYAEMLLDREMPEEERVKCVEVILRNGETLLRILNDILDLSKIEAGKISIERISCSPIEVVQEVTSLLLPRALGKELRFLTCFRSPIPEKIQTDPLRLRQILLNLIGNALKFTQEGSVGLEIDLVPGNAGPLLRFEVRDTGIGISEEQQARLFERFSQGDASTVRKYGGSGLGLVISRRLAAALGGEITLKSVPGKGSTFTLTISTGPLEGVRMVEGPLDASRRSTVVESRAPDPVPPLQGSVLLAEDSPDSQGLIAYYLKRAGATVALAADGKSVTEKALRAAEAGKPFDLILMDMQMPILDGNGATRLLRQKGYSGPIVALTANAMASDRELCLLAGCNDFIPKPVTRARLLEMVRRHLRSGAESSPVAQPDRAGSKDPGSSSPPPAGEEGSEMAVLIGDFLKRSKGRLEALKEAFKADQIGEVASFAHQLKGTAGNFGFLQVSEAAAKIQDCARSGKDLDLLPGLVRDLEEACDRMTAADAHLFMNAPLTSPESSRESTRT